MKMCQLIRLRLSSFLLESGGTATKTLNMGKSSRCRNFSRCGCSTLSSEAVHQDQYGLAGRTKLDDDTSVETHFDFSTPVIERIPDWKKRITSSMLIYPTFVREEEEKELLLEIEPSISRLQYETAHWDDAIHHYRETERKTWNKKNVLVINRIRSLAFPPSVPQLQLVHVLDLGKSGVIKPHIDSVRFCGNTIAGLSLLSNSVMRLVHEVQKDHFVDVYLPRYSLYVMSDLARYEFTHEILGEKESRFRGQDVPRDRRVSIMCRNEPETPPAEGPVFKSTGELLQDP